MRTGLSPTTSPVLRRHALRSPGCIAVAFLLGSCSGGNRQPLEIGAHRGTLVVPEGWSLVNLGTTWEVR
jgi:hypothetical protein